jgi:hypothetical protein
VVLTLNQQLDVFAGDGLGGLIQGPFYGAGAGAWKTWWRDISATTESLAWRLRIPPLKHSRLSKTRQVTSSPQVTVTSQYYLLLLTAMIDML